MITCFGYLRLYLIAGAVVLLCACGSDAKRFQDQALTFASDNRIDESEYTGLLNLVKSSTDGTLNNFRGEGGEPDRAKVTDYLIKLFAAKKLPITSSEIWQPATARTLNKFDLDVYIENSSSMDGYVLGVTEFETAIYNLLADLKISGMCNSLNLNYINSKITFTKTQALDDDVRDFIEKLEPSTFAAKGGDRGTSDLEGILKTVVNKLDHDKVAIVVSDFVFSPGKNKDAQDYLNNQSIGVKVDFANKLQTLDLAAIIIQLDSKFNGKYFDKFNNPRPLNCKRPYYIWVLGTTDQIRQILSAKLLDNIKGGYLNRLVLTRQIEPSPLKYKVLYQPRIGSFVLAKGADGPISQAKAGDQGVFQFNIAADFSNGMEDIGAFLDPSRFRISDPRYVLTIDRLTDSDPTLKGFSHRLTLETKSLSDETIEISVLRSIPSWVESSTSDDDTRIASNNDEARKTFGLKYLIGGVYEAFYPQGAGTEIYKGKITISK